MTDSPFRATVDISGLSGPQRAHLDQQLRAEAIPAEWAGEALLVDQAFEPRVATLIEGARYAAPGAPAPYGTTAPPVYPAPGTYQPSAYPPAGYPAAGYPAAGYAVTPTNNSNAVLALVFGIIGLVSCAVFAIPAIILGRKAQQEIAASNGTQSGEGLAKAGVVMGWIEVGLLAFFAVIGVLVLVIGIISSTAG